MYFMYEEVIFQNKLWCSTLLGIETQKDWFYHLNLYEDEPEGL